ncbi:hypothetical protein EXIGLDRAFT_772953, partial [Exidia glandulosa HHB12029]
MSGATSNTLVASFAQLSPDVQQRLLEQMNQQRGSGLGDPPRSSSSVSPPQPTVPLFPENMPSSLSNELRNWMDDTRAELAQQLADQAQRIETIARKRAAGHDSADGSSADDESSDGEGTSHRKKSRKRKKKSKPKPWYECKEKTEMQEQMLVKARGEVKTTFASFIFLRTSKYEDEADSEGVLPDQNESKKRFDIWESWRKLPRPGEKRVDRAGNEAHKVDFEDTAKAA